MSETPRTGRARLDEHDPAVAVASECSKLERELNAAQQRIRKLEELVQGSFDQFVSMFGERVDVE